MKRDQFIQLLRTPSTINLNLISELEDITTQFPYFQNAHLLLAKQYHGHENIRYENYLRKASAYSPDRTVLYRLIQSEPAEIIHIPSPSVHEVQIMEPEFKKEEIKLIPPQELSPVEEPIVNQEIHVPVKIQDPMEIIEQRIKEINRENTQEKIENIVDQIPSASSIPTEKFELHKPETVDAFYETLDVNENENIENVNQIETRDVPISEPDVKDIDGMNYDEPDSVIAIGHVDSSEEKSAEAEGELEPAKEEEKSVDFISEKTISTVENETNSQGGHSFLDWLKIKSIPVVPVDQLSDFLDIDEVKSDNLINLPRRKPQDELLDKFIITQPRIVAQKSEFYSPGNMARKSAMEHEDLISETLARIYAQQGNIPKAIEAYRRLGLKSPEKSSYFAALIKELEEKEN